MLRCALVVLVIAGSVACSHSVVIESAAGAEIMVDGTSVGRSPATYTDEGGSAPAKISARLDGREKTILVPRSSLYWEQIALGATAGTAACVGLWCGFGFANLLTGGVLALPLGAGQCAACGVPFATTGAAWGLNGHKLPDSIRVELEPARRAMTEPAGVATPAASPAEGVASAY